LIGNISHLKLPSTEQAAVDPVDTKVLELMLEGARPGVIFGKKGVHIKELCKTYNVTARFTKAGTDRQKYFYDDPVLVVISAPVGHDQDISQFEDALTKHVESVKKKEKKHSENVSNAYVYHSCEKSSMVYMLAVKVTMMLILQCISTDI